MRVYQLSSSSAKATFVDKLYASEVGSRKSTTGISANPIVSERAEILKQAGRNAFHQILHENTEA
jgi:hypothetical protein